MSAEGGRMLAPNANFRNSRNKAIPLEMAEAWITRAEQQKVSTSIVVWANS
jgi:hypothetical protein